MAFITIAGENKIALQQGSALTLNVTHFVLANIAGLGAEPVDRIEAMPAPADIVDTRLTTKDGYVNANQVVYSLALDSTVGDYEFNWVGIKDADGVLIAVTYLPAPVSKTATAGGIDGNNLVRNFLVAYSGLAATAAVATPAETWQIDFTTRLLGIDERERLSNFDLYGHDAFHGDGLLVVRDALTTNYNISAGVGYVGGVRIKQAAVQALEVLAPPKSIWADVSLQGDINGVSEVVSFIADAAAHVDYTDGLGFYHYVAKLADVLADGTVVDVRVVVQDLPGWFDDKADLAGNALQVFEVYAALTANQAIPKWQGEPAVQFHAHEAAVPDMTVVIDAGMIQSGETITTVPEQVTVVLAAPVINPRIDRIVIDNVTGDYSVLSGVENIAPVAPTMPPNKIAIAKILLATTTAAITDALIMSERALFYRQLLESHNNIGIMGTQGAGVGIYPDDLPKGFREMEGATSLASDNYGNYQYSDGSVMCWVPLFYYRIGHAESPNTAAYGLNAIDIASESDYADFAPYISAEAKANANGYALHRAFKDGGATKRGFFIDKYQASNNAGTASSLRYGLPLSTHAAHNPINSLTGSPANNYAGTLDAAKTRGSQFSVCSRFIYSAMAILSMAHGQAATADTYCAWYDGAGITNYPKGNNNDALGDANDASISYESDGYLNCGKAGSGTPFSRTAHNGQPCGVVDINGNVWEVSLGLTRPGASNTDSIQQNDTTAFYVLKEAIAIASITSGFGAGNDAWGTAAHLATLYDPITLAHISTGDGWRSFGNAASQVLSSALSGDGYRMTGLGIYKDANGESLSGIDLFGGDGVYEYHRATLCVLSSGAWTAGSIAGPWTAHLDDARSYSGSGVGFRAACYFD